jgi:hypothetical protein
VPPGEERNVERFFDLARRHVEERAERVDLVARHLAVDLGHLGAERDHADGKGDLARAGMAAVLARRRTEAEQRRQRFALDEPGDGVGDASPDAHGPPLQAGGYRIKEPIATATRRQSDRRR